MIDDKLELMARLEHFNRGVSLYARIKRDGASSIAKPIIFEDQDPSLTVNSFITLDMNQAQSLMDELWQCGLRPTEGTGSAGSLAATQKHLEDFRKIAFKGLDIKEYK